MNHYETVFILTPVLSEPQMKEAVEKFKDVIVNNEGRITNEELWGAKKLAYPIQKKTTGYYTLIEFDAEPSMIERLTTAYRRDERVLRFLTFNLDKYAYEYALKRRSVRKAKAEEAAKAEAEAAAEAAEAPAAVEEPAVPAPVEEPAAPAPAEAPAQPEATPEAAPEAEETKE